MKKSRFSDQQIAFVLRQAEVGTAATEEICGKMGVAEATFYRRKKQFAGMGVPTMSIVSRRNFTCWTTAARSSRPTT
jgi:hypothetical protein